MQTSESAAESAGDKTVGSRVRRRQVTAKEMLQYLQNSAKRKEKEVGGNQILQAQAKAKTNKKTPRIDGIQSNFTSVNGGKVGSIKLGVQQKVTSHQKVKGQGTIRGHKRGTEGRKSITDNSIQQLESCTEEETTGSNHQVQKCK